jgi:hypothetical protein
MGNDTLIKGASLAYGGNQTGGFLNPQAGYVQGVNTPMSELGQQAMREAAYKRRQDEIELKNYVNSMETVDLAKVEESMRPEVTEFLVANKKNYAEAARLASDLDADDPMYMKAVSEMNQIDAAFKALSGNLDMFKKKRTEFYDDVKANNISKASNKDALNSMFKNSDYAIEIDEFGALSIENDGEYVPMTDFEEDTEYNYFLTDNEDFTKLMDLTNSANSGATVISGGLEQSYKYKLNGIFNTMGREDLMSMMYDTVINDVPLKDREDFDLGLFEVEREDELREWLSDTYMNSLKTVAASSAKQKEIANRPKPTRGEILKIQNVKKVTSYFNKMKSVANSFIPGLLASRSIVTKDLGDGTIGFIPVLNGAQQTDFFLRNDEEALTWLNNG